MEKIKQLINMMQEHKLSCSMIAYFINLELAKVDKRYKVSKYSVSKWGRWKKGDPHTTEIKQDAIIKAAKRFK